MILSVGGAPECKDKAIERLNLVAAGTSEWPQLPQQRKASSADEMISESSGEV